MRSLDVRVAGLVAAFWNPGRSFPYSCFTALRYASPFLPERVDSSCRWSDSADMRVLPLDLTRSTIFGGSGWRKSGRRLKPRAHVGCRFLLVRWARCWALAPSLTCLERALLADLQVSRASSVTF